LWPADSIKHYEISGALRRHPTEVRPIKGPQPVGGGGLCAEDVQRIVHGPALQAQVCHALQDPQVLGASESDNVAGCVRDVFLDQAPGLPGRDCRAHRQGRQGRIALGQGVATYD